MSVSELTVKYPEMRGDLVSFSRSLGDVAYQRSCWVEDSCPEGVGFDNFSMAVSFLFDDTVLSTCPESLVGEMLTSASEVDAVRDLCEKIDFVLCKYGDRLSDREYIDSPEWPSVVSAAQTLSDVLAANRSG